MEVKLHMFSEKGLQIKENYLMNFEYNQDPFYELKIDE